MIFYFIVITILLYFIILVCLMFFGVYYWVRDFIAVLYQTIVYIVLGFLYRPRGIDIDQLLNADDESGQFGDHNSENGGERDVVDLEDLDDKTFLNPSGKRQWQPGDKLPLEPTLKDRRPADTHISKPSEIITMNQIKYSAQ